ncbi:hypothetical protein D3C84_632870 [compost metagenome]
MLPEVVHRISGRMTSKCVLQAACGALIASGYARLQNLDCIGVFPFIPQVHRQHDGCVPIALFSGATAHLTGYVWRDIARRQLVAYICLGLGTSLIGGLAVIT